MEEWTLEVKGLLIFLLLLPLLFLLLLLLLSLLLLLLLILHLILLLLLLLLLFLLLLLLLPQVERVAPSLKVTVRVDSRDWRSHLEQMHTYRWWQQEEQSE